jgi:WD40 repeat protein
MGILRPLRKIVGPGRSERPTGVQVAPQSPDDLLELRGVAMIQSFRETTGNVFNVAWSPDGDFLAATSMDGGVAVWPATAGQPPLHLHGHGPRNVLGLAWHPTRPLLTTAARDCTVRLWNLSTGVSEVLREAQELLGVSWSPDGRWLAATDAQGGVTVWDERISVQLGHTNLAASEVARACWSPDGSLLIVGGMGMGVDILGGRKLEFLRSVASHLQIVDLDVSPAGDRIATAVVNGGVVSIWDVRTGQECIALEGHTDEVNCVRYCPDGEFLATRSARQTRLWRCRDWECVAVISQDYDHTWGGLDFHPHQPLLAIKGNEYAQINCWRLDYDLLLGGQVRADSRRYVNAKVVLLGDTGVGKSGLGLVLSGQEYRPTDSTHGRNVWTFGAEQVEAPGGGSQTREVLLWDLAGQPGYRLVHQLHLNEVAVALIVFDSRSETDPFSGVKHWVRALAQARRLEGDAAVPLRAYLVAARADRGGVAVTRDRVRAMVGELGLNGFFETSAKEGWQVTDLAHAIRTAIDWDALPMVSSNALFDSIKQYLVEEKQQGRLLSTVDDLFRGFQRTQPGSAEGPGLRASFAACVGRVESRGLIRRLHFGGLVLLQPELLDAYASAMVQAAKEEPEGLGFITEQAALNGGFRLGESERITDRAQEKLLLIATVEELLRHEIALKETTDRGADLVFPSQFTRERPDPPGIPGQQVVFTFEGPLYSIYATLAVRLSHSLLFQREDMWQNVASYTATGGGRCGLHVRELDEGRGELVLFFDGQAGPAVRIQFEAYVFEHLRLRAIRGTVSRRGIRTCSRCGYVVPENLIRRRLDRNAASLRCPDCEEAVISLVDEPSREVVATDAAVAEMNRSADAQRNRNIAETRLKGKIEANDYDVFLCYNTRDRQQVKAIASRLKEYGILPWLDVWDVRPGTRWQDELARQITSINAAAVFLGPGRTGPWQDLEIQEILQQFAKRKRPVIPVILEGRTGRPQLPGFLGLWHVVDMRQAEPEPMGQLVWGITGEKQPLA